MSFNSISDTHAVVAGNDVVFVARNYLLSLKRILFPGERIWKFVFPGAVKNTKVLQGGIWYCPTHFAWNSYLMKKL